jgi:hypothetical protein
MGHEPTHLAENGESQTSAVASLANKLFYDVDAMESRILATCRE